EAARQGPVRGSARLAEEQSCHQQLDLELSGALALSYSSDPQVPLLHFGGGAAQACLSPALRAGAHAVPGIDEEGACARSPGSRPTARCSGRAASVAPLNGNVRPRDGPSRITVPRRLQEARKSRGSCCPR